MTNLELALRLAADGFYVFPCIGDGPRRKAPHVMDWRGQSTLEERQIRYWWARWPDAVPGIDCGKSDMLVLDCDRKLGDGLAWVREQGLEVDGVPGSITPTGGRHLVYRNVNPPLGNGRGGLPDKKIADADVRGAGGYIIAPGATFADGSTYRPMGSLLEIGPLPPWLFTTLTRFKTVETADDFEPLTFTIKSEPINNRRKELYGQTAMAEMERDLAGTPEGARNDTANLTGFRVGQLVGGGCISAQEAYERLAKAALSWGISGKDRVLGARGTIWRAIQEGMKNPRGPKDEEATILTFDLGTKKEQSESEALIRATPYAWTDPKDIPMRDWLYGWLLVRKFVSFTVAPGGSGKSSLVTAEALAMVSGRDLLGIEPKRGGLRVWLWNLEDPQEEITRKIQAIARCYGLTETDLGDRIFVNSGRDQKLVVVKTVRGETVVTPIVDAMVAEVKRLAIDVLIIDPFVSCNEVDENDNSGQDMVVKAWAKVAELANCAVHLVDHTRKAPEGTEVTSGSTRGASSKTDAARVVRAINQMSRQDAEKAGIVGEERRKYFRAFNDKSNMAPPAERSDWYRLTSMELMNGPPLVVAGIDCTGGDSVGVVVPWEFPQALIVEEGAVERVIAVMGEKPIWREDPQSPDWLGLAVVKVLKLNVPKIEVKKLIEKWTDEGSLERYKKKDQRGKLRWLIRVPE